MKRIGRLLLLAAFAFTIIGIAGVIFWRQHEQRHTFYTDGNIIHQVYKDINPDGAIGWDNLVQFLQLMPWRGLLAVLLPALFLLVVWRSMRSRQVNLPSRCLIASLIIHAIIMIVFMFWRVTDPVIAVLQPDKTARVLLTIPADMHELQSQLRSEMTGLVIDASAIAPLHAQVDIPVELSAAVHAASPEIFDAPKDTLLLLGATASDMAIALPDPVLPAPDRGGSASEDVELAAVLSLPQSQPLPAHSEPTATSLIAMQFKSAATSEVHSERIFPEPLQTDTDFAVSLPPENTAQLPERLASDITLIAPIADSLPVMQQAREPLPLAAKMKAESLVLSHLPLRMPMETMPEPQPEPTSVLVVRSAVISASNNAVAQDPFNVLPIVEDGAASTWRLQPLPITRGHLAFVLSGAAAADAGMIGVREPDSAFDGVTLLSEYEIDDLLHAGTSPTASGIALPEASATDAIDASLPQCDVMQALVHASVQVRSKDLKPVVIESDQVMQRAAVDLEPEPIEMENDRHVLHRMNRMADAGVPVAHDPVMIDERAIDDAMLAMHTASEITLRMPADTAPLANTYAARSELNRQELVRQLGGDAQTEQAVMRALVWLAAHQSEDGRWPARGFDDHCGQCGGPAQFDADVATTSLALLCFLAADHTHVKTGPYRHQVEKALAWLLMQQKPDGDLRRGETMYSHGIATIVLAEVYGMTGDEWFAQPVKSAVDFIACARHGATPQARQPYSAEVVSHLGSGGWRYRPGQFGDTSVLGWQVMALISAKRAGIDVPQEALQAAADWMEQVDQSNRKGLYSYQPNQRPTPSMTAEGMYVQQLLGRSRDELCMRNSADYIIQHLPQWSNEPNTYYWYYATLALIQHQGEHWQQWNAAMKRELLANQCVSGPAAGSWDPVDKWSIVGGRIYQTALCTLSLEVYYRYLPMYASFETIR